MNEPIRTQWEIRCAFNGFCKQALKREAMNAHRDTKRQQSREVTFSDLSPQGESLLSFMQSDSVYQKYRDEVIILLGTELRISELCGLTETDLDFENRVINVDHQLLRSAETGYYIEKPKTQSGIRQISMSEKVYEALGRVLENRRGAKATTIDGYSNFLFLNRDGCPKTNVNYATMFRGLTKKYNKSHEETLPKVMTPHTLRHTFCTNLGQCRNESESVTVYHGTLQYHHGTELLRIRNFRFRKG